MLIKNLFQSIFRKKEIDVYFFCFVFSLSMVLFFSFKLGVCFVFCRRKNIQSSFKRLAEKILTNKLIL